MIPLPGIFCLKNPWGWGGLAFGEPLMAKNEQTMLPVFASDKIYLYWVQKSFSQ